MKTRRHFLTSAGATVAASAGRANPASPQPLFSIGLMADCQYADLKTTGSRFYRQSPGKLRKAIDAFNQQEVAATFHLGDFIDRDLKSFDVLELIVAKLKSKLYHALGNHDFDVSETDKGAVLGKLGLKRGFYGLQKGGFRFLVIDTTEVSTYRYPKEALETRAAEAELSKWRERRAPFAHSWNSRVSDQQVTWIESELREATVAKQSVILLGHHPILPEEGHSTWNCQALHQLFHRYPCAKAYLNGHNHAGAYVDTEGFHFLTLDGMLETKDQNAFAVAHLHPDRIEIVGRERQESYSLKFR